MSRNEENNLISIDDVIFRAKSRGVDFGKGDPRERLRYLTKIGLLPHAKRKSFNGKPPNGAYPEYIIELLKEIDEKIKAGKSIQELKKEKERKSFFEVPYAHIISYPKVRPPSVEVELSYPEVRPPSVEVEPQPQSSSLPPVEAVKAAPKPFLKLAGIFTPLERKHLLGNKYLTGFTIIFLLLIFGGTVFFLNSQEAVKQDFSSYLLASFNWVQKLVQAPLAPVEEIAETREIFLPAKAEPYLTINAETDINAPLNVKEQITTPSLSLLQGEFKGTLALTDLTTDRTYTFPDLSGIVCLTTGNCVGLGGGIFSPGGTTNRLAKFLSSDEIGDSSIEDLYPGVALTIDSNGRLGVGIRNPRYSLHVAGRIQATGDICTNLAGGRCLSTLPLGGAPSVIVPPATAVTGIGGSGTTNYLPIWSSETALGDSLIYQSGFNIGIGTTTPTQALDVAGTIKIIGFQLPTGAQENYVLTSDADGFGIWRSLPEGNLPSGALGQTLRHNGTNWVANSFLFNTGTALGIGTTATPATLTLSGNAIFATATLPQLVLKYNDGNYLNFAINGEQTLIESSKRLVFNSLTGEVRMGANVDVFDAFGAEIRGATFISAAADSTVRKSGELVFQASLPIFRFPVPAQTTSTEPVVVSKTFSLTDSLDSLTPARLPGASRVYAFSINFSDNIAPTSSSTWRVYRPNAATTTFSFGFAGQDFSSLETGSPHLTATTTLPDNDWQLEARVPSANKAIRVFNIFLLVFDQIN